MFQYPKMLVVIHASVIQQLFDQRTFRAGRAADIAKKRHVRNDRFDSGIERSNCERDSSSLTCPCDGYAVSVDVIAG